MTMRQSASGNSTFIIPIEDKYIVYQPIKPLAFIANKAMKDFIQKQRNSHSKINLSNETVRLLHSIGFFSKNKFVINSLNTDKAFKPTTCVLLLTTACNLGCIYCYASSGEKAGQVMPLEVGQRAIDIVCENAKAQNKQYFVLGFHGGGEPTVAKNRMFELLHYAKQKDLPCRISITTNGYWTEKEIEQILQNDISEISLSCDGIADVQNRQRPAKIGGKSFESVFNSIRAIQEKKIPYGIRLTVMDDSINCLPESIDFFCRETTCQTFQVEPVFNHGRAATGNNALQNSRAFTHSFMNALEIAHSHGRHMYYSGARPWIMTDRFCMALDIALIVNHNSDLTACYEVYDRAHELSDLFLYGSIEPDGKLNINNDKRNTLFEKINTRKQTCIRKNCYCFHHCAGDCPPKAFHNENHQSSSFSHRCQLNRALTKELLLYNIEKSNGVWHGEKIGGK